MTLNNKYYLSSLFYKHYSKLHIMQPEAYTKLISTFQYILITHI